MPIDAQYRTGGDRGGSLRGHGGLVMGGGKMSRGRSKISHIVAIAAFSVLVASATVRCAAWAKGGDQGNSNAEVTERWG
jgi:hypothetical protein